MKIKGVKRLKGFSIFPNTEKTVFPANHKYGAVSTWSHCTDTQTTNYPTSEINAFKYNLAITAFLNRFVSNIDAYESDQTGRIGHGVYFVGMRYRNPFVDASDTDPYVKYPLIPDFWETTWSQAAVDAGFITADKIGTTKPSGYPNHGQEMFDLTNGKFGYDLVNGVTGQYDVLTDMILFDREWFKTLIGYYPSVGSYSYGLNQSAYKLKEYYLGMRNSGYAEAYYYGYSRKDSKYLGTIDLNFTNEYSSNMYGSSRQYDEVFPTRAEALVDFQRRLNDAIVSNGWYSDFTHWHNAASNQMEEFFSSQRQAMNDHDVVTLDYGTALEHLFLRQMVRRITLYTDVNELVLVTDVKDYDGINLQVIRTPLSVELDTTGTILEGKEIQGIGDMGIVKKGINKYVIEVPYFQKDGFSSVRLKETITPSYMDFNLPVINSVTKTSTTLTVETNKPTNLVLFGNPRGQTALYNSTKLKRSNTMSTTHQIDISGIDFTAIDAYIGVITKNKQSVLSSSYQW